MKALILVFCLFFSAQNTFAKDQIRVGAVQYPVKGDLTYTEFVSKVRNYIKRAKKDGVELLVFPEYLSFDLWPNKTKKDDFTVVSEIEEKSTQRFLKQASRWAKEFQMTLVAGTVPRKTKAGKIRNTAVIAFPNGQVELQDKVNFVPWETKIGLEEGDQFTKYQIPGTDVSFYVLTCYDIEFPRISQMIGKNPADIVITPSMTTSTGGFYRVRYTAQARAVEQHSYVLVTGTVGKTGEAWSNFGQAAFLGPQDVGYPALLKQGPYNKDQLVSFSFDLKKIRESRAKTGYFPVRKDVGKKIKIVDKTSSDTGASL